MVPQKFQMKDLLKGFQGVMNFAMFRWIFDPLQTFQKSAIFIALMVNHIKRFFLRALRFLYEWLYNFLPIPVNDVQS